MDQDDVFASEAASSYNHLVHLLQTYLQGRTTLRSASRPLQWAVCLTPRPSPRWSAFIIPDFVDRPPAVYEAFWPSLVPHKDGGKGTDRRPRHVNYRHLSVQQLGSIYELPAGARDPVPWTRLGCRSYRPNEILRSQRQWQLLYSPGARRPNHRPEPEAPCGVASSGLRGKGTTAYLQIAVPRTCGMLTLWTIMDLAVAVLDLKVLDPAMGSGHFLVNRRRLPLGLYRRTGSRPCSRRTRVAGWRVRIAPGAARGPADPSKTTTRTGEDIRLDDRPVASAYGPRPSSGSTVLRRRCIYDMYKNPMTVERGYRCPCGFTGLSPWAQTAVLPGPSCPADDGLPPRNAGSWRVLRSCGDYAGLSAQSAIARGRNAATGEMQHHRRDVRLRRC